MTWKESGTVFVERCLLLDNDDVVYSPLLDQPLTIMTDEGVGHTVETLVGYGDRVCFEDDEGIFFLKSEQILHIKDL